MSKRIGFVGVGKMGANMARHLKDNGWEVTSVYDIDREAASSLAGEIGAAAHESLADVTAASDTVITVVSNDDAMRAIFFEGDDNLLALVRKAPPLSTVPPSRRKSTARLRLRPRRWEPVP